MPGPMSAPQGARRDPAKAGEPRHGKCQDRAGCTGPGCRVSTGKTRRASAPDHITTEGNSL